MRKNTSYKKPKITELAVREDDKLMEFLLKKMGGMKRNAVKALLHYRQVSVNNKVVTQFDFQLKPKDLVTINTTRGNPELQHPLLKVIYEDNDLIVVVKREGLLTVTVGTGRDVTAFSILKNYVKKASPMNKIYTVHRLDRDTSGILVFAKNRDVQHYLRNNWHRIVTKRLYVAVVEGNVEKDNDCIVSWLTDNDITNKVHSSFTDDGGKKAVTHYRKLDANDEYSLLEVELETGKKNQIRTQMEAIGHPIVGDRKYGAKTTIGRLALHAYILEFHHPATDELMHFETPVPNEFKKLVRQQR